MATAPRRIDLDHMVDVEVAVRLEADSHDVLRAYLAGMGEASDPDQLQFATDQNRILCTQNIRHFEPLAKQWADEKREHSGLLVLERGNARFDLSVDRRALELQPDMHNVTLHLSVSE